MNNVFLRNVEQDDLTVFFDQQLDREANRMAAFTAKDPTDKDGFMARWERILSDPGILSRTVVYQERTAGHVLSFEQDGKTEVSYWIGRKYWGLGLATQALMALLNIKTDRPVYARVAKDNAGSVRVLEKCGFKRYGEDKGFSNARQTDVEEFLYVLDD